MMKVAVARTPRMGIAAGLIAVLAASVSLAPLAVAQNGRPIAVTPPGGAPVSFADLIERVSPAVVSVQVTTEMKATSRRPATSSRTITSSIMRVK